MNAAAAWRAALAVVLFLLELVFAAVLQASNALSRVALRRVAAESGGALRFLDGIRSVDSPHRLAVQATRSASLLGGALAAGAAAEAFGARHPWLVAAVAGAGVGVVLVETVAARLAAVVDPRAFLRRTGPLVVAAHACLYPVVAPAAALLRRAGVAAGDGDEDREGESEEVEAFIEVGEREGILEASEGRMVRGIVDLADTRVREIMTPRTDIVAIPAACTVGEARRAMLEAGHSRLPVFRESIDNVVGVLHVRDLLLAMHEAADDAPIVPRLRPAFFVPETQLTADLLAQMRTRTQIALVVDEYGGLAGLVTLEDLLEEIVGEIREEHEKEEPPLRELPDGSWLVSGLVHVEDLERLFAIEVGERDFDTVGGLVVARSGRVPETGESLEVEGVRLEVMSADRRRVYSVKATRFAPRDDATAGDTS